MLVCKPISTPVEANTKLCVDEGKDLEDSTMYRQLVGSLIYLTMTRSDICNVVGVLSRFMQKPKKPHLKLVQRILRCVKGTFDFGILYKKGGTLKMKVSYVALCVILVLLLSEARVSLAVTCNALELSSCLSAITSGGAPSGTCCNKLREQRPCLCQYLKDPNLKQYVSSPNARKVASTCGVAIPNC
ncbi:hypothetical protein HHK36_030019 [Tetracentron sinense]|uniref:Bifunctional inhibitor/plant lipid transfer protein/seed storage helical domain-containing protein n=1 Tax=Tetracentron sinense TaxID=13715 RepID=A0A835D094_TETSI|nr:hypothetical protein HHK36_030019 [Tetracentron sinense]